MTIKDLVDNIRVLSFAFFHKSIYIIISTKNLELDSIHEIIFHWKVFLSKYYEL